MTRRYLDLDAMRDQCAARLTSDRALAAEALGHAEREAQRAADAVQRVRRGYQNGTLDDDDYREQRSQVLEELSGAQAAVERGQNGQPHWRPHGLSTRRRASGSL